MGQLITLFFTKSQFKSFASFQEPWRKVLITPSEIDSELVEKLWRL